MSEKQCQTRKSLVALLFSGLVTLATFVSVSSFTTQAARPFLTIAPTSQRRVCSVNVPVLSKQRSSSSQYSTFASLVSDTDHVVPILSPDDVSRRILATMSSLRHEAHEYASTMTGFTAAEAAWYALFAAIRHCPDCSLGLTGTPFFLRHSDILSALEMTTTTWPGYFSMKDLEKAVTDDFLDAVRGSTDNRKGWKITTVSQPRGQSFEEARMTFADVQTALEKGTVIFNAAGAHIPKLAAPSLACTDAVVLPCALNLYVTAPNLRTSAPPHTDKQDVAVVQTSGRKHWRVYAPPPPQLKPQADVFARGKLEDSLPFFSLDPNTLLIDVTLRPGDVLFIPAGFPHTTSTVNDATDTTLSNLDNDNDDDDTTSIHLTLGMDHHIWELDYVNARRLALRRAGVVDSALGQTREQDNPFIGKVNQLPEPTRSQLLSELPLGLLDENMAVAAPLINRATRELEQLSFAVDEMTAAAVAPAVWEETILRLRQAGRTLLDIHRDMYLAAIEEGQKRDLEDAMTAHLKPSAGGTIRRSMSPERMQRLSLFRVKQYFDKINESKAALQQWSREGTATKDSTSGASALPAGWEFTLPLRVGDDVEADLGGAFFPAKVTRASGGTFDVQFFDGDQETGVERSMLKLLTPPATLLNSKEDVDNTNMTSKQLKRRKKLEAKSHKRGFK